MTTKVRVRMDGELGRPVANWLTQVHLNPQRFMDRYGVVDRRDFTILLLESWGTTRMTAVDFQDGHYVKFIPNPCLEFFDD